jgi:hypothetical protein
VSGEPIETDYLVVGCGAVGMAFADSLVHATDDRVLLVDRHHAPGGHWNDAYPFVRLHQPSAYYGVNSRELSEGGKDLDPLNAGMTERATVAQILTYYEHVLADLLSTGRVVHQPMAVHERLGGGAHRVRSLLTGDTRQVHVRKRVVDTTYLNTAVPSTHPPRYAVDEQVSCVPINALARIDAPPARYVVIGAGKTGIDACLWLLAHDVNPDLITWVMPRDSWFQDRANVQPGREFLADTVGAIATQMESIAAADSLADLLSRLEGSGQLLRLDPAVEPQMYHAAVVSRAELEQLRRIRDIVRLGRVTRVEPTRIVLERGTVAARPDWLYVDCSASAAQLRPAVPVFRGDTITPQFVRPFQPTFSAAMIAFVEAHYDSDDVKNEICGVVPLPDDSRSWLTMQAGSMLNQLRWSGERDLRRWISSSRLDGFSALSRSVDPDDPADAARVAALQRVRSAAVAAGARLPDLLATTEPDRPGAP